MAKNIGKLRFLHNVHNLMQLYPWYPMQNILYARPMGSAFVGDCILKLPRSWHPDCGAPRSELKDLSRSSDAICSRFFDFVAFGNSAQNDTVVADSYIAKR